MIHHCTFHEVVNILWAAGIPVNAKSLHYAYFGAEALGYHPITYAQMMVMMVSMQRA